jgi:hypothetical protein
MKVSSLTADLLRADGQICTVYTDTGAGGHGEDNSHFQ